MITLSQVAKEAGVAQQTVSRILNGQAKKHRPATVTKVMEAAERLSYRPNAMAQSMRQGKTNRLALLDDATNGRSALTRQLLRGIQDRCQDLSLGINLTRYADDALEDPDRVNQLLRDLSADGLLLNFHSSPSKTFEQWIAKYQLPAIWLNNRREYDAVYLNDEGASLRATQTLIKLGHTRIAFLSESHTNQAGELIHYSKGARYEGYREAMRRAGLEPQSVLMTHQQSPAAIAKHYRDALSGMKNLDAIITYSPREYYFLTLSQFAKDMPIDIRDLACATFGEQIDLEFLPILRILNPVDRMGPHAVDLLQEKINDPSAAIPSIALDYTLENGISTSQ